MNRQLDLQMKIEEGKHQIDTWFNLDREWIPTDIDKFLEDSGWVFSYYEDNIDYDYYFIYNGVSHRNEGYILTFC